MNELTKRALAGTAKTSGVALATGTPLDAEWNAPPVEPERELLLRAGADAVVRLAGHTAETGVLLPDPAPDDPTLVCSPTVAALLAQHFDSTQYRTVIEACSLIEAKAQRLPHTLLPRALMVKGDAQRDALRPLLGERGRWLSEFNPDWRWVRQASKEGLPPNAEEIWQTGTPDERIRILEQARAERPAEARHWLEQVWREEKADFRAQAVQALRIGLSIDDETFLERVLDDRSQNVRSQAADLLTSFPSSAFVARMRERGGTMLAYTPPAAAGRFERFMRSVTATTAKGTLAITLPETFDKSWARDGITERPEHGIGPRTWWLIKIIGKIPPSHWETLWNASIDDLLAAALAHPDHGRAVLKGWGDAALAYRDARWALPLWHLWANTKVSEKTHVVFRNDMLSSLLRALPDDQLDALAYEQFGRSNLDINARIEFLRQLPRPWSTHFGFLVLDELVPQIKGRTSWEWNEALMTAGTALPRPCVAEALRRFEPWREKQGYWHVHDFLETLDLRQRFYEEIDR
jgi:hypothetical protein